MDNVTHALAGSLLAASTVALIGGRSSAPSAPTPTSLRTVALTIGIVTAELPDADLLYAGPLLGMGKLGYLLHHRGHTHTVLFALGSALLVWGLLLVVRREWRGAPARWAMLGLAIAGTLSHLLLDFSNSYGVHPFWPLDNRWYYGDAVFIIEPWLFVIAVPPLLLLARGTFARVMLAGLLLAILGLAWFANLLPHTIALALTLTAVLWFVTLRRAPSARLGIFGVIAWLGFEGTSFAASAAARGHVRDAIGSTYRDVALTPAPANPFCFTALVVTLDQDTYRVIDADAAAFPAIRTVGQCRADRRELRDAPPRTSQAFVAIPTPSFVGHGLWSAPIDSLRVLASRNCEVAAALRFLRVPEWTVDPAGTIVIADARFGGPGGGFASVEVRSPSPACPRYVPTWVPPRLDLLGDQGTRVSSAMRQTTVTQVDAP